jgi:membrane protein
MTVDDPHEERSDRPDEEPAGRHAPPPAEPLGGAPDAAPAEAPADRPAPADEAPAGPPLDPSADPAPDAPRTPWFSVLRRSVHEFGRDGGGDIAASLTFRALLAAAPATVALVSLLGFVGNPQTAIDRTLDTIKGIAPPATVQAIEPLIKQIAGTKGSGWALLIGLVLALWSASGFVGAFGRAMNKIYDVPEGRPVWRLRPWLLLVTLVVFVLVVAIIAAMVLSGSVARQVGDIVGLSATAVTVWNIAKWPVILVLVILLLALLYWATPNVKLPRFRWLSPGAILTIVVGAVATGLFGVYVAHTKSYNATYGTFAGLFILLLWVYILCMVLVLGAELDAESERARELRAAVPAETNIQLPLRGTKASDKAATKRQKTVERSRALREDAPVPRPEDDAK